MIRATGILMLIQIMWNIKKFPLYFARTRSTILYVNAPGTAAAKNPAPITNPNRSAGNSVEQYSVSTEKVKSLARMNRIKVTHCS